MPRPIPGLPPLAEATETLEQLRELLAQHQHYGNELRERLSALQTLGPEEPEALADISERRKKGESLRSIAATYGVSAEWIRLLCLKHGFQAPPTGEVLSEDKRHQALQLLDQGQTTQAIAKQFGIDTQRLRDDLRRTGDFSREAGLDRRLQLRLEALEGQAFGDWTVLPRTYPAPLGTSNRYQSSKVDCRCSCGLVKPVRVGNLLKGLSLNCHACGIRRRDAAR